MCDECGSNEMRVFFTRKEGSLLLLKEGSQYIRRAMYEIDC